MRQDILHQLSIITPEEEAILAEGKGLQRDLYFSGNEPVIDCRKLLDKGQLIQVRPHTRFLHFPPHRHNYVELVYMAKGHTTHIINGTDRLVLEEGDLLFLNQLAQQEILPAGREDIAVNFLILPEFFTYRVTMFEQENLLRDFLFSTLSGPSPMASYLHLKARGIVPIENAVESMIWTILNSRHGNNVLLQTTMGMLLLNLSSFARDLNRSTPGQWEQNTVFQVMRYIEDHYRSGSLEDAASQLCQPPYAISRLMKKHTGMTFSRLLCQRKLQQAAYLLSHSTLPVEQIIRKIGYENSSYFYHRFREKYGCSPKDYRNQII